MCWNEEVSWTTFIIGTLANIMLVNKIKDKKIYAIAIIWQWVLLMQFFEALIWRNKECNKLNKFASIGAFIANITQPLVVFLALLFLTKQSNKFKIVGGIAVFIYLSYVFVNFNKNSIECVKPRKECRHLEYGWFSKEQKTYEGLLYLIALFSLLLLAKPSKIFMPQFFLILGTFILANITQLKCGLASTWCWLAAFAPIFTYLYHKRKM